MLRWPDLGVVHHVSFTVIGGHQEDVLYGYFAEVSRRLGVDHLTMQP